MCYLHTVYLLGPPREYWEEEVVFQPPWSEPVSKVPEQGELLLQPSTQTSPSLQTSPQLNMPTLAPSLPSRVPVKLLKSVHVQGNRPIPSAHGGQSCAGERAAAQA